MVLKNSLILVSLVVLTSCGGSVQTASKKNSSALPDGEQLYLENCASCHGIDGTLGKAGANNLSTTKLSDQEIKTIIEVGNSNGMPRFKEILGGDEEIEAVLQYIKGFRRIDG